MVKEVKGEEMQRKMKRTTMVCAVLLMALTMLLGLAGCEEAYDPTGLVKANLDYMTTGEITDEILAETDQSEEELKKIYEEDLNSAVDAFVQGIEGEAGMEVTEEMRGTIEEFIVAALKKSKYEVKPEFTEEEGIYSVDVDVYPMDFLTTVNEWLMGEEYLAEWEEKIVSGEYVYTTDEKLMEDIYYYMFDKIAGFVEETGYLEEPVTMTIKVEESDENVYTPNQADLDAVGAALLGE